MKSLRQRHVLRLPRGKPKGKPWKSYPLSAASRRQCTARLNDRVTRPGITVQEGDASTPRFSIAYPVRFSPGRSALRRNCSSTARGGRSRDRTVGPVQSRGGRSVARTRSPSMYRLDRGLHCVRQLLWPVAAVGDRQLPCISSATPPRHRRRGHQRRAGATDTAHSPCSSRKTAAASSERSVPNPPSPHCFPHGAAMR